MADCVDFRRHRWPALLAQCLLALCLSCTANAATRPGDQNVSPARSQLIQAALQQLGARYQLGGSGQGKFDCSGLVQTAYKAIGKTLPRTAREMQRLGERIAYRDARPGDLLIYDWGRGRGSSLHVMIYLGDDLAVHASPSARTVEITSVASAVWRRRFVSGARILVAS